MPQYIKKEGEVIDLLEYLTEKPDINRDYKSFDDYKQALEAWHKSAVKTPFHESHKEAAVNHVLELWKQTPGTGIDFNRQLSEGILIPDGLCEKKKCWILPDSLDRVVFAFIKESKPVEETNEDEIWRKVISLMMDCQNITTELTIEKLKSKFTITRK